MSADKSGEEERELLFCDTFSHEGEDVSASGTQIERTTTSLSLSLSQGQLHVDMVKFIVPVNVKEVRVIPNSVKALSSNKKLSMVG